VEIHKVVSVSLLFLTFLSRDELTNHYSRRRPRVLTGISV
jgi:hypothetical protein